MYVYAGIFSFFLLSADFFFKINYMYFKNKSYRSFITVSNSLDPDHVEHFVCKDYKQTTLAQAYNIPSQNSKQ